MKTRWLTMILMVPGMGLLLAGWAGAAETNSLPSREMVKSMALLDNRQELGPGDRIVYRVVEDQDEPRSLTITDSGDLEVPYYGLVHAAGKTSLRLAREIKGLLEKKLYYQATVIVALEVSNKTRVLGKVYVTGQVRNSGSYDIPAGNTLTVSKAILLAGGFSDFSDKKGVRLIRRRGERAQTYIINVMAVWERGKVDQDMVVEANDLVVVPQRLVNF